jgi:mono/diheme cytochrome c family protein
MTRNSFVAVTLLGLALTACGGDEEERDVSDVLALTGDAVAGESVYNGSCASTSCHGPDGRGGPGADLPDVIPTRSDEQIATTIRYGVGAMTPQSQLTAKQIADVIAFVKMEF